jgi:hypothetical protein
MANKKVSQLVSKPSVLVTDLFPIADPTTGQLFKTTISDLGTAIGSGVSSVNTLVGAVVLDTDDIQELASPTNRWFTDTRARAAISGGTGISYNSGTGVITNAVTSGQIATALGYTPANDALVVKLAGSQTITGTKTFQQAPLLDLGAGFKNSNGVYNYLQSLVTGWQMPVNGNNHNLIFSTTTNYVYTFPNASGTIALTSDLTPYALDNTVVKLTGNQTIAGIKTFSSGIIANVSTGGSQGFASTNTSTSGSSIFLQNNSTSVGNSIGIANTSTADGIAIGNDTSGRAIYISNATVSGSGKGISIDNYNAGIGIEVGSSSSADAIKILHQSGRAFNIQSSGTGFGVIINNTTASTSAPFTIQKQGATVISMTDTGAIAATSIELTNGSAANALRITHTNTSYHAVSITATGGSALYATGSVTVIGTLNATGVVTASSGLSNGAGQSFALPSSTGTLALTSQLSAYLPLSGGTLTGALSGTSATFSGAVQGSNLIASAGAGFASVDIKSDRTTGNLGGLTSYRQSETFARSQIQMKADGAMTFNTGDGTTNVSERLTIASTGAATFSSSVITGSDIFTYVNGGIFFNGASSFTSGVFQNANGLNLQTGGSPKVTITSAGFVGIGTTAPTSYASGTLQLNGSGQSASIKVTNVTTGAGNGNGFDILQSQNDTYLYNRSNGMINFGTNDLERMRITSGGFLKVSNNATYRSSTGAYNEINTNSEGVASLLSHHYGATPYGVEIYYMSTAPNNTSQSFVYCQDTGAQRAAIRSNGGLANYQANNVNLSDERTKKEISPLESYWNKFKAMEIVKFKYKDQTHDDFNIGVIAQQVESVAPEFVDVDGWEKESTYETPLKSIYTADLYHASIGVLKEAMAKIETLEAKIKTLENK